jgi:REP element-mobilizing transposase RayT
MPTSLRRYYGAGYLDFITTSCYQRRVRSGTPQNRDLFLEVIERVRRRYRFVVVGYVVMSELVHLLFSEPQRGDPSLVMQQIRIKPAHTVATCRANDPELYQVLKVFWRHSQDGAGLLEFECKALHLDEPPKGKMVIQWKSRGS